MIFFVFKCIDIGFFDETETQVRYRPRRLKINTSYRKNPLQVIALRDIIFYLLMIGYHNGQIIKKNVLDITKTVFTET